MSPTRLHHFTRSVFECVETVDEQLSAVALTTGGHDATRRLVDTATHPVTEGGDRCETDKKDESHK